VKPEGDVVVWHLGVIEGDTRRDTYGVSLKEMDVEPVLVARVRIDESACLLQKRCDMWAADRIALAVVADQHT
jgi:hypothetical protein